MATDYPDAVDSLPRPTAATAMNASGFEGDVVIDNISDAIEAIETELGTNPSGAYATVAEAIAAGGGSGVYQVPAATGVAATDTATVQAAVNTVQSAPVSSGVIGRTLLFPPGEYVLNASITMDQWTGTLQGQGVGNSPAYSSDPGSATVFRWAGSAAAPMFLLSDDSYAGFSDIRFEGNDTNVPSYAIESRSSSGYGAGTGEQLKVSRCYFGKYAWSSQGTWVGDIETGIGFTGDNANNDQFVIEGCHFERVGTGVYLPNSQSIWGRIVDCYFQYCDVAGINTAASVTVTNGQFIYCEIDIKATSTALVHVHGWWSELSSLIYDIGSEVALYVDGGKWQIMSTMSGNSYINAANTRGNDLVIRNVYVAFDITAIPLYAYGTYAVRPYRTMIQNCKGLNAARLDVQGYTEPGYNYVDIDTEDVSLHTTMTRKAISTYITPQTKTAGYTLIDGEIAPHLFNGSSLTATLPNPASASPGTGTCRPGATRFVIKNIHSSSALTVAATGGSTVYPASLAAGESKTYVSNGTNWYGF